MSSRPRRSAQPKPYALAEDFDLSDYEAEEEEEEHHYQEEEEYDEEDEVDIEDHLEESAVYPGMAAFTNLAR